MNVPWSRDEKVIKCCNLLEKYFDNMENTNCNTLKTNHLLIRLGFPFDWQDWFMAFFEFQLIFNCFDEIDYNSFLKRSKWFSYFFPLSPTNVNELKIFSRFYFGINEINYVWKTYASFDVWLSLF